MYRGNRGNIQAKIAEHRKLVDQLKKEESITRINVSQAAADLIKYIEANRDGDPLLRKGRNDSSPNPCRCM